MLGSRQPPALPVERVQEGHTVFATKEEADTGEGVGVGCLGLWAGFLPIHGPAASMPPPTARHASHGTAEVYTILDLYCSTHCCS